MKKIVAVLFAAGLLTGLFAGEAENFSGHTELSYANTSGNTNSQDIAGNLKLKYPFYQNAIRFVGNVLYSTSENFETNVTSATKNSWDAEANYDYNFNEAIAFNYIAGAKGNKFSSFVYQAYTGPGAVWTAVKNDTNNLKFQGNILWAWDDYREPYKADSNDTLHSYAAYQVSLDYVLQFSKSAKFVQYLMYRSEFQETSNYFMKSKSAVEAKMSDIFSLGVSYTIDYTNDKEPNVRSYTDSVFLASLIADF